MKTINKRAKFETLQPFCLLFRTSMSQRIFTKTHRIYRTGIYTVCWCVRASFTEPGTFTAGAVKGLGMECRLTVLDKIMSTPDAILSYTENGMLCCSVTHNTVKIQELAACNYIVWNTVNRTSLAEDCRPAATDTLILSSPS